MKRNIEPGKGKWSYPGGFVELGESIREAAARETLEEIGAQVRETTLVTGVYELYQGDMGSIATLVLLTVVIVPAIHLLCMLYILVPLRSNRVPRYLANVFRMIIFLKPWGMMEVFLLGILVSVVKLVKMATIIPGVALFAFLALIFVLAAMSVTLDDHLVWHRLDDHQ